MAVSLIATAVSMSNAAVAIKFIVTAAAMVINYDKAQAKAAQAEAASQAQMAAAAARGVLLNINGNIEAIPVIYGKRKIGGIQTLVEVSGASNEYLHVVLVLGESEISAINDIQIDDVPWTDVRFSGLVSIEQHLGTDAQAASASLIADIPSKWTAEHKGSGIAYLVCKFKYDRSAYPFGLPTVTSVPDGRVVYDPRSGLYIFSDNPALVIRDYLTNERYGRGVAVALVDDSSFIVSANYCDEMVDIPGGTQKRYTCNGLVDTGLTVYENMKKLLTSCRGSLVFSGGKYKLVLDKPTVSTFAFTEDNIVGAWEIRPPSRQEKFNRVTATFNNPDKNWQPDLAIQQSVPYRIADGGKVIEAKIDLPFTSDMYRAQQIAQQELKQSRFGTTVRFRAFQEGLQCDVGDVATITHSTPNWNGKTFRILNLNPLDTDEVEVVCREYDDSVYTLDPLTAYSATAAASLPDASTISMPGNLDVVETLYHTSGSVGVRSRASVSWTAPADPYVLNYELEYRRDSGAWVEVFNIRGTTIDIDDLPVGMYEWRVKTVNILGVSSAYSAIRKVPLYGLVAAPADVVGFSLTSISGQGRAAWDLHPDLDVRIGGRILFRWSPALTMATWQNAVPIGEANGDAMTVMLPLLTGTYLARAEDSTGNLSATDASFVASEALATGWTTVATSTQQPVFSGTKTNLAAVDSAIKLSSSTLWDDVPGLVDSFGPLVDNIGGVMASGTYEFDAPMDFGTLAVRKLTANIASTSFETGDLFDMRSGLCDSWGMFDGAEVLDCIAKLNIALSDDAITYGPWFPFMSGEFDCMAAKFKLDVESGSTTHNISISQLSVTARIAA